MTGRIWRTFQGVALLLALTALGVVVILAIVGRGIDAHQAAKETGLVELRLSAARQAMVSDLTAATIWDEAVARLSGPVDPDWIDHHLGPFYAAQSGHVATMVYNGGGEVIRTSLDGAPSTVAQSASFVAAAAPLVTELRGETALRDRSSFAMAAVRSRSGVVAVNGKVYQLGVSSVVRHTASGPAPGADPVVASFKPFEASVSRLGPDLGLRGARFAPGPSTGEAAHSGAVAVVDPANRPLGWILWTPEAPGSRILARTLPFLVAFVILMAFVGAWLFRSIAADVRRLGESEAALAGALERAEAGSAAKSRFLANVSHELRTPLNGVLGMAEILEGDLLTPQQRDRMAVLKASGRAQLRLIENLLLITRLQSDAVTIISEPFSLSGLIARLIADWRPVARAKDVLFEARSTGPDLWSGDAQQILRVLDALVDNAIRVTGAGAVAVSIRKVRGDLILEVRDGGPGLDPRVAAWIGAGGRDEPPPSDGAGLGLQIVLALVGMMGGEVSAPPQGDGGTVRVRLARAGRDS